MDLRISPEMIPFYEMRAEAKKINIKVSTPQEDFFVF